MHACFGLLLGLLILTQNIKCENKQEVSTEKITTNPSKTTSIQTSNILKNLGNYVLKPEPIRIKKNATENDYIPLGERIKDVSNSSKVDEIKIATVLQHIISDIFGLGDGIQIGRTKIKRLTGTASTNITSTSNSTGNLTASTNITSTSNGTKNKTQPGKANAVLGSFGSLPLFTNMKKRANGNGVLVLGNNANVAKTSSNFWDDTKELKPSKLEEPDIWSILDDAGERIKTESNKAYEFVVNVPDELPDVLNIFNQKQGHDVSNVINNINSKRKKKKDTMNVAAAVPPLTTNFANKLDTMNVAGVIPNRTTKVPKYEDFFHATNKRINDEYMKREVTSSYNSTINRATIPIGAFSSDVKESQNQSTEKPTRLQKLMGKINMIKPSAENTETKFEEIQKAKRELENANVTSVANNTAGVKVGNESNPKTAKGVPGGNTMFLWGPGDTQNKVENVNSLVNVLGLTDDKGLSQKKVGPELKNGVYKTLEPQKSEKGLEEIAVGFEIKYHDWDKHKAHVNKVNNILKEDNTGLMDRVLKIFNFMSSFSSPFHRFIIPKVQTLIEDRKQLDETRNDLSLRDKLLDIFNFSNNSGMRENENKSERKRSVQSKINQGPNKFPDGAYLNGRQTHESFVEGTPCRRAVKPTKLCKKICKSYNYASGKCNDAGLCTCHQQKNKNPTDDIYK